MDTRNIARENEARDAHAKNQFHHLSCLKVHYRNSSLLCRSLLIFFYFYFPLSLFEYERLSLQLQADRLGPAILACTSLPPYLTRL